MNFILINSDNNFVRAHPYLKILEKEPQAVTGFRRRPGSRTQQMVTLIVVVGDTRCRNFGLEEESPFYNMELSSGYFTSNQEPQPLLLLLAICALLTDTSSQKACTLTKVQHIPELSLSNIRSIWVRLAQNPLSHACRNSVLTEYITSIII